MVNSQKTSSMENLELIVNNSFAELVTLTSQSTSSLNQTDLMRSTLSLDMEASHSNSILSFNEDWQRIGSKHGVDIYKIYREGISILKGEGYINLIHPKVKL